MSEEGEELCLASVQLAVKFLFSVGFRVKKTLRGPVNDWYEILYNYAKHSLKARQWLARYFLVENSLVIPQYLLDCPSNEIRSTISKMLVALVHLANTDAPMELKLSEICAPSSSLAVFVAASASQQQLLSASQQAQPIDPNKSRLISVSDSVIQTLLSILSKRDLINEQSSKYLIQFFQFFTIYCSLGIQQVRNLPPLSSFNKIFTWPPYRFVPFVCPYRTATVPNRVQNNSWSRCGDDTVAPL